MCQSRCFLSTGSSEDQQRVGTMPHGLVLSRIEMIQKRNPRQPQHSLLASPVEKVS